MKLQSVIIKRFRSIQSIELTNCAELNVLIGKNNSGKSNILSAIDAFYKCIEGGNAFALNPPIGQEIDFFKKETKLPIEITLTFWLSEAERNVLIQDIVTEMPQVKNVVEGVKPLPFLLATIDIYPSPTRFGYVKKLALESDKTTAKHHEGERLILSIGPEAGRELREQFFQSSQQRSDAQMLSDLDDDRLRTLVTEGSESRPDIRTRPTRSYSFRYFLTKTSDELRQMLEAAATEATSPDDFVRKVRSLTLRLQEMAAAGEKEPLKHKIGTFAGEESSVPNYVRNLLRMISDMKVLHLTERRKEIGKEEASRLLSLKVTRGGEENLRSIKETVAALLGVQIDAFQGKGVAGRLGPIAELDVDKFLVEVNGSGIREALRLVFDYEFEHPKILLVEEPEIHLHPGLETSMMRYLKRISSDCQVFITTHSTNFLDTAEMKNVYLVSKANATEVRLLNLEEAEAELPKELGIRLSSLFMYDRIVFVEGQYDEDIIREWASKLRVSLSQYNAGFIAMGGVRNFTHFAAQRTISFLAKRQVKMWFLVDRDERDDSEIAKLVKSVGDNAVVKALERRQIENYLICPRAILEFIRLKRELQGNINEKELPSEADIEKSLDECVDKLKQTAIDKRVVKILCNPVYPSRKRISEEAEKTEIAKSVTGEINRMIEQLKEMSSNVESVYKKQSEYVNKHWQANKFDVVPGDLLLDKACEKYSVRFKKDSGDSVRLAALMNENEIDGEITKLIREIGS